MSIKPWNTHNNESNMIICLGQDNDLMTCVELVNDLAFQLKNSHTKIYDVELDENNHVLTSVEDINQNIERITKLSKQMRDHVMLIVIKLHYLSNNTNLLLQSLITAGIPKCQFLVGCNSVRGCLYLQKLHTQSYPLCTLFLLPPFIHAKDYEFIQHMTNYEKDDLIFLINKMRVNYHKNIGVITSYGDFHYYQSKTKSQMRWFNLLNYAYAWVTLRKAKISDDVCRLIIKYSK